MCLIDTSNIFALYNKKKILNILWKKVTYEHINTTLVTMIWYEKTRQHWFEFDAKDSFHSDSLMNIQFQQQNLGNTCETAMFIMHLTDKVYSGVWQYISTFDM